jgi:hypothetical protein
VLSRVAAAATIAVSLAFAGTAFAGKTSSSSITGPYVVTASTASALVATSTTSPRFGDTVTFDISTTQTGNPFVHLVCSGTAENPVGYDSWAAFWPSAGSFILGSGGWTSGGADCTANLVMYVNSNKYKVIASTSFHVDA